MGVAPPTPSPWTELGRSAHSRNRGLASSRTSRSLLSPPSGAPWTAPSGLMARTIKISASGALENGDIRFGHVRQKPPTFTRSCCSDPLSDCRKGLQRGSSTLLTAPGRPRRGGLKSIPGAGTGCSTTQSQPLDRAGSNPLTRGSRFLRPGRAGHVVTPLRCSGPRQLVRCRGSVGAYSRSARANRAIRAAFTRSGLWCRQRHPSSWPEKDSRGWEWV